MAAQRLVNVFIRQQMIQGGSCSVLVAGHPFRRATALWVQLCAAHATGQGLLLSNLRGICDKQSNHTAENSDDTIQAANQPSLRQWQHQWQQQMQQHTAGFPSAAPWQTCRSNSRFRRNESISHLQLYRSSSSSSSNSGSSSSNRDLHPPERELPGLAARLHMPPAIVAAAASASCLAQQASAATTKQVYRILKLVQQTSFLQAAYLQLSSMWQQHSTALTALAAAAATAGVYQLTYSAAACFIDMTQPAAVYACVGTSAAAVAGLWLYARSALVVDPERVYAVALRKVMQHAGVQEVMGTPIAGSPLRMQLIARGSYFIQESLLPKTRAPRIHMLFPLTGPLKSGVVSLQAKKVASGKYAFKTLMVELPSKTLKGADGTAAAASAALQATAVQKGSSSNASSSSSTAGMSAPAAVSGADDPARVYIIGKPKRRSSSDAAATAHCQIPTAQMLLEQLKQPMVFALQQNVVLYETEDELENDLGYDVNPELDPEQVTVWDWAKQGTCVVVKSGMHWGAVAGCKAVQLVQESVKTVQHSMRSKRLVQPPPQQQQHQHRQDSSTSTRTEAAVTPKAAHSSSSSSA